MKHFVVLFWTFTWISILLLIILLTGPRALAANTQPATTPAQMPQTSISPNLDTQPATTPAQISGRITDRQSDEPIPYAHIALFAPGLDELLGGTTSDMEGYFSLVYRGEAADLDLRISSVAHETLRLGVSLTDLVVEANEDVRRIDLGQIQLNSGITGTEEVLVTARQVLARTTHTTQTYFIHESMQNSSGSASELMRQIPGVFVDLHQTITFEGNANVQIMVDGRRRDAAYLRQIPSESVQKVDLQRNPGVQSEGSTTAVIHITTNLRQPNTVSGSMLVDVPFRTNEVFSFPSYSVNAGVGNWNFHTSYTGELLYFDIEERASIAGRDGSMLYESTQQVAQKNWSHRFNYSIEWDSPSNTAIQYYGWLQPYSNEHNGTFADTRGTAGVRTDDNRNFGWFQSVAVDHSISGRLPGMLSAEMNWFSFEGRNHSMYSSEGNAPASQPVPSRPVQHMAELHAKAAFELSSAIRSESGFLIRYSRMHDKSSTLFDHNEQLFAGFQSVQLSHGNTTATAGLRGEWYTNGWSILPAASLSHRLSHRYRLDAGWKTMTVHPALYQRNTSPRVINPATMRVGTEGLRPERTHSLELGISGVWSNAFGAVTGFRRVQQDIIGIHAEMLNLSTEGIAVGELFMNTGDVVQHGVQLAGSFRVGRSASLNGMGSVFQSRMKPAHTAGISNRLGADFSGSMVISAGAGLSLSAQVRYMSDIHQMQGESYESTLYFVRVDKQFSGGWSGALVSAVPLSNGFVYSGQRLETPDGFLNSEGRILTSSVPLWVSFSYTFSRGAGRDWAFRTGRDIVTTERKGF
jgi:hypothetical protein